jgi:Flp pilus assembly protein TadG
MTQFDNLFAVDGDISVTCVYRARPALGRHGAVAMLVGLSAPMLLMAISLGVEVASWTVTKQKLQRTADAAALAAAEAYYRGASAQTAATYGAYVAEMNDASGGITRSWVGSTLSDGNITVQKTTGPVSSSDTAFLATIKTKAPLLFSAYVLPKGTTTQTITATATAEIETATAPYCILALDTTTANASGGAGLNLSNNASLNISACGAAIDTPGPYALYMTGGATLTAGGLSIVGTSKIINNATMTVSGMTSTGASQVANPYANVSIPTTAACTTQSGNLTSWQASHVTLNPGTFCSGISISSNLTNGVTFNPGVYILNNSSLSMTGSTITGTGVTFILTGTTASQVGTATIGNGANVALSAPTSGSTSGLVILQDPKASSGTANNIAGGSNYNVTGALVFPKQAVNYSNGSTNNSTCTQLIAWQLVFTGGVKFGNTCAGTGTLGIGTGPSGVMLVR